MSITREQLHEIVNQLFDALDTDKSGFLERPEVHKIAQDLHSKIESDQPFNDEQFEKAFTHLDKNGDGRIARDELLSFFTNVAIKRGVLQE